MRLPFFSITSQVLHQRMLHKHWLNDCSARLRRPAFLASTSRHQGSWVRSEAEKLTVLLSAQVLARKPSSSPKRVGRISRRVRGVLETTIFQTCRDACRTTSWVSERPMYSPASTRFRRSTPRAVMMACSRRGGTRTRKVRPPQHECPPQSKETDTRHAPCWTGQSQSCRLQRQFPWSSFQ